MEVGGEGGEGKRREEGVDDDFFSFFVFVVAVGVGHVKKRVEEVGSGEGEGGGEKPGFVAVGVE